ncbi:IS21 family transposase [Hoeflea sp.]|uniref:IS21 family transposase n=1 Tax=Hoeflea sp. TaxID=1940281 RepID=UPI0019B40788|nr:IS21 family transposase [Hoeflea sp.]MBC7286264.1 IS21 family transposase [Hoeflea sp.]MBP8310604.1 IS21 family transposase [Burkholderiaceae bacterium]
MPGRFITDRQHEDYMTLRPHHTQKIAAAKAGFSASTGSRIDHDPRPPSRKNQDRRHAGGKPDPLAGLWEEEIVPFLEQTPGLRPVTVLEQLQLRHPDRDLTAARRTLERRMRTWRARHGEDREVIFRQNHPPGRQGMSDFFDAGDLAITVAGAPLNHRIYHFTLVCSGWEHAEVVLGGESYTALASGLQNALCELGGVPHEHRTDSLSAAFANLDPDARDDLRQRYDTLCSDLGTEPTRNNRGIAHENGSIESRHGHLKARLDQALLLRGSRNFEDVDAWRRFVAQVVARHNARHRDRVEAERPHLRPLPARRSCDYDEARVRVTSSGGFVFRKVFYTVPSRLIGYELKLRAFDDRLELFLGSTPLETLPRGRAPDRGRGGHAHVVDYHHVIHSLRKKPGALANLAYRDVLFPRTEYRDCWEALKAGLPLRHACKTMVGLLWLAHEHGCEAELAAELARVLAIGDLPDLAGLRTRFTPAPLRDTRPEVPVQMPATSCYDALLPGLVPGLEVAA